MGVAAVKLAIRQKEDHVSVFQQGRLTFAAVFAVFVILVAENTAAQMLDPAIDRDNEPFCYFSQPTDVIGVMDGKEGTLVTPEGYLYTGYGEVMFFSGNPPEPIRQRVKTLYKGYLPIVEYAFARGGVSYQVSAFAATLDRNPESALMNFVRVTITNQSKIPRAAFFGIGTRYQNDANTDWGVGDNRFGRPAKASLLGQFEQAGEPFSKEWEYSFGDGVFLRDGKVMYLYPDNSSNARLMTLKTGYNEVHELAATKLDVLPTTPVGIVVYAFSLASGETQHLEFKIPYEPIPQGSPDVALLKNASFDDYLNQTVTSWDDIFARGIEILLPEEKVTNTFKANLVYDLIARNKQEGSYIQKVNEFQYDSFWLRDASFIVRMYDLSGYHEIARQCLEFFPRWQQPDGNYVSQGGQFDGWGQSMWAYGQHFRITQDRKFAESVYPSVVKAVQWLRTARQGDPLHLVPVTTPGDNEGISGHVTGHNFWALAGLKSVTALAQGLGKEVDAAAFQAEYDDLREALVARLRQVTAKTGGYMPPGLDSVYGQDWGNMMSVYPEIILDPYDPMVTATMNATRAKYQEGIMTYGNGRWLHHYLTMKNTETEIIRGDQEYAIKELYALLVHTGATHTGFEFSIRPWGARDFGMNLAPHGWFGAKYRATLRNMLVREQGEELHLFSCLSPEWVRPGATIAVRRAPTYFGQVGLEMRCLENKASFELRTDFFRAPKVIVLHFPWFMQVGLVRADGVLAKVNAGMVTLSPNSHKVDIQWVHKKQTPALSYTNAVRDYKREYRRKYQESLKKASLPE
jgi:hypothetical protein